MKALLTIITFTLFANVLFADTGRLGISLQDAEKSWGKSEKKEPQKPAQSAHKFRVGDFYIVAQVWKGTIHQIEISKGMKSLSKEEVLGICKKIGGDGEWPEKGFLRVKGDKKVILQVIGMNARLRFRTSEFETAVTAAESKAKKKAIEDL